MFLSTIIFYLLQDGCRYIAHATERSIDQFQYSTPSAPVPNYRISTPLISWQRLLKPVAPTVLEFKGDFCQEARAF